jgi:hypothetical protein
LLRRIDAARRPGAESRMLHARPSPRGLGVLGGPPPALASPPSRRAVSWRHVARGLKASVAEIFSPRSQAAGPRFSRAKISRLLRLPCCVSRRRGPPGPRRLSRSEGTRKGSLDRGRAIQAVYRAGEALRALGGFRGRRERARVPSTAGEPSRLAMRQGITVHSHRNQRRLSEGLPLPMEQGRAAERRQGHRSAAGGLVSEAKRHRASAGQRAPIRCKRIGRRSERPAESVGAIPSVIQQAARITR